MRGTNREEVLAALNMSAGQAEREVLAALVALDEFRHLPEDVSLLRDNFSHKQKCPDIGIDRLVFRRIFIVICPIPLKQNGAFIRPLIQQSNPHRMNHIRIKIVPDTNRIQPIIGTVRIDEATLECLPVKSDFQYPATGAEQRVEIEFRPPGIETPTHRRERV